MASEQSLSFKGLMDFVFLLAPGYFQGRSAFLIYDGDGLENCFTSCSLKMPATP
jgi:hypothetical protein